MKFPRSLSCRAFTLVEIMVAIAIFTMIMGAVYTTFVAVMRASQVGRDAAAQAQRQRIALRTIEDSLMCIQSFQASQKYYSFIVENGDPPILSFASRLPEVFPRNGKFPDSNLRRLIFTLEADADGGKNLVLRQNPILKEMDDDEQKYPLVLARNVKTFTIDCWDTNQLDWVTEWNDTNSIPPMLRVGLVLGANTDLGNAAPSYSVVRAIAMPSSMMPQMLQIGGANGAGGAPAIRPPISGIGGKNSTR